MAALRINLFCLIAAMSTCASCQKTNTTEMKEDQLLCRRQVGIGAYCVMMYRGDHDGKFPNTLGEAVGIEGGTNSIEMLSHCPIRSGGAKYAYINWSKWFENKEVPTNYPVVYESVIGKHGNGVNVALVNGSVFWDEHVNWIADFSKKHPDYHLTLPRIE